MRGPPPAAPAGISRPGAGGRVALRICMLVRNDVLFDSRVRREASSLVREGHDVVVLGRWTARSSEREHVDGFLIQRIRPSSTLHRMEAALALSARLLATPILVPARAAVLALRVVRSRTAELLRPLGGALAGALSRSWTAVARVLRRLRGTLVEALSRWWSAAVDLRLGLGLRPFVVGGWRRTARALSAILRALRGRTGGRSGRPLAIRLRGWIGAVVAALRRGANRSVRLVHHLLGGPSRALRRLVRGSAAIRGRVRRRAIAWLSGFLDPHYCAHTVAAAIDQRADVYHAHDLNTLRMAHEAALATRSRFVYDSHELYLERHPAYNDYGFLSNLRLRARERRLIRKAAAVVTVNDWIAAELERRYGVRRPWVVQNAPPAPPRLDPTLLRGRLAAESEHPVAADAKVFLYIGNLTAGRGLESVIASIALVPGAHFVLMGACSMPQVRGRLEDLAEVSGVLERVHFLEPVPSEEVSTYASGADLGVVSVQNCCLSYYLSTPNKLFECITANLPLIASDFPALRSIVTEYGIGELFDPDDPSSIARAAGRVLADQESYRRRRENVRRAALDLNWEAQERVLGSVYRSLGAGPGG